MKQEEVMKTLIKELFKMDNVHEEYQDKDTHFVVDSQKDGNTLTIKVKLVENKDKKEFEKWLKQVDDTLFSDVLDELREKDGLVNLNELYNSERYGEVIKKVKAKTKEIAARRIKELQKLI